MRGTITAQWIHCNGPYGGVITCLEQQPVTGSVFAGTQTGGLFKRANGSATWTSLRQLFPNQDAGITDLHATGSYLYALCGSGLYRTSDDGQTWQTLHVDSTFYPSGLMYCQDSIILVSGYPQKLYVSTNSGVLFQEISSNISDSAWFFHDIAMVGQCILLLSSKNVGYFNTVSISNDFGQTWSKPVTDINPPGNWSDLWYNRIRVLSDGIYALGANSIYRSQDNGLNWSKLLYTGKPINSGATDLIKFGDTILVSTDFYGMYASFDDGNTYSATSNGLPLAELRTQEYLNTNSGRLVIASLLGVFASENRGNSYFDFNNGIRSITVTDLSYHANQLVAGTAQQGVYFSTDMGNSWTNRSAGLENFNQFNNVLALTSCGNRVIAGTNNGLFVSDDNGNSWNSTMAGLPNSISAFEWENATLYVGTTSGLYKSNDCASTFSKLTAGPLNIVEGLFIEQNHIIAQNVLPLPFPNYPVHFDLLRSTNGGASFSTIDTVSDFQDIERLGNVMLAANSYGNHRLSFDEGQSWQVSSSINQDISDFFILDSLYVFAITRSGQVFRSDDTAATWLDVTGNYLGGSGKIFREGRFIYIASSENGVWKLDISHLPGISVTPLIDVVQIHPNPNGGCFQIMLPETYLNTGFATVEIWDQLGRRVFSKPYDTEDASITVESYLAQGMYVLNLTLADDKYYSKVQVVSNKR